VFASAARSGGTIDLVLEQAAAVSTVRIHIAMAITRV
jgi:hypothetical protein